MKRVTTMAAVAGLLVVLLGIVPKSQQSVGSGGNSTSAFNATTAVTETAAELIPLVVLLLAVGAIVSGTGILGAFR